MSGARFACLFDLDGTLVDTDRLHLEAYNRMLKPMGRQVDLAYYKSRIMGFPNDLIMPEMFPEHDRAAHAELTERKEALFRSLLGQLEPTPGLTELLAWAAQHRLPTAVVTNAPRANAERMLDGLGLGTRFDTIVIGDELVQGKPHPLPYLTALERLGGRAEHAVAFEDSLSGVRAASAAGVHTYGLMTSLTESALREAGAAHAIADFRDGSMWQWLETKVG